MKLSDVLTSLALDFDQILSSLCNPIRQRHDAFHAPSEGTCRLAGSTRFCDRLNEDYAYENLMLNARLTGADFDCRNPEYRFERLLRTVDTP
jgi:hypothetical protein